MQRSLGSLGPMWGLGASEGLEVLGLWGQCGALGNWGLGALGPWGFGALGPWGFEALGLWGLEALGPYSLGASGPRSSGALGLWGLGSLGHWSLGALSPWGFGASLGPSTRKHKDRIDENCLERKQLSEENHRACIITSTTQSHQ